MDIRCSGGGLVLDGILKGHFAIGLEGSDYSKKRQRAEWRLMKWWKDVFVKNGFEVVEGVFSREDLARANGNPPNCWMLGWGIERSAYIVAKKAGSGKQ